MKPLQFNVNGINGDFTEVFMKKTLKKILFISLLFSAVVPSAVQASFFSWATLKNGAIESGSKAINWLTTNGGEAFGFLKKHKKYSVAVGAVVASTFLWKARKKLLNRFLWTGLRNGNIYLVRTALYLGADANEPGWVYRKELALALGKHPSKLDLKLTPLNLVLGRHNSKLVELLLKYNADLNKISAPLAWAARESHSGLVELLIKYNANVNEHEEPSLTPIRPGLTPLMNAARRANNKYNSAQQREANDIIELLLENGADPLVKARIASDAPLVKERYHTTVLDQENNETINEHMRKKIFPILNNEEFSPLSSNLAQLTAKLTY